MLQKIMRLIFSCAARVPIISDVKGNHVRPLRCVNCFFKFDHLVLFCFVLFLMYFILLFLSSLISQLSNINSRGCDYRINSIKPFS